MLWRLFSGNPGPCRSGPGFDSDLWPFAACHPPLLVPYLPVTLQLSLSEVQKVLYGVFIQFLILRNMDGQKSKLLSPYWLYHEESRTHSIPIFYWLKLEDSVLAAVQILDYTSVLLLVCTIPGYVSPSLQVEPEAGSSEDAWRTDHRPAEFSSTRCSTNTGSRARHRALALTSFT